MKSLKVDLNHASYPLFVGDEALSKLPDLLALYRYPERGFLLIREGPQEPALPAGMNISSLVLPAAVKMREFSGIAALLKIFPWRDDGQGVTLAVQGGEDLINLALFALPMIALPTTLVLIPASGWSMVECGVRVDAALAWRKYAGALQLSAPPHLVILDCTRLQHRDADEMFLLRTAMARSLLLADTARWDAFARSWSDLSFSRTDTLYATLESACRARIAVLAKGDQGRFLVHDFGRRAVNHRPPSTEMSRRQTALRVQVELGWRLSLSQRFDIITRERLDPLQALLSEIRDAHGVTAREWGRAKQVFEAQLAIMQHNIHVPEGIGRLQKIKAVDEKAAQHSLKNCHV